MVMKAVANRKGLSDDAAISAITNAIALIVMLPFMQCIIDVYY